MGRATMETSDVLKQSRMGNKACMRLWLRRDAASIILDWMWRRMESGGIIGMIVALKCGMSSGGYRRAMVAIVSQM